MNTPGRASRGRGSPISRGRGGPIGRGRGSPARGIRGGISTRSFVVDISSSDDDTSDDIPMINRYQYKSSQPVELSSESLESDDDEGVVENFSNNQSAIKVQVNSNRRQMNINNIQETSQDQQSDHNKKSPRIQVDEFFIDDEEDDEESEHITTGTVQKVGAAISIPENMNMILNNNENNSHQINQPSPEKNETTEDINFTYDLYKVKKALKRINQFRMEDNGIVCMHAKSNINGKMACFVKRTNAETPDPKNSGFIKFKGNSFLICLNEQRPNDDRTAEVCCGIWNVKGKTKYLKIVLPSNNQPHYPISKRRSLLTMIQSTEPIDKKFLVFESSSSVSEEDLKSHLGNIFITPSTRNIILKNEEGKIIFCLYKIADSSYKIYGASPLTPAIAFGIGIAIIS